MKIIQCDTRFLAEIQDIFNEAILNSTALYEYKPRSRQMIEEWFAAKAGGGLPVIGMATTAGELMGFASYGLFRPFPAYKYAVEHSIYVARQFRGQGVGKSLLQEIILRAELQGYHTLIGAIDAENTISRELHRKCGFRHVGTVREAGFKFGRWLNLELYQFILATPSDPRDDEAGPVRR